eukprot:5681163-Alexandrium_andersonii.AAC.1
MCIRDRLILVHLRTEGDAHLLGDEEAPPLRIVREQRTPLSQAVLDAQREDGLRLPDVAREQRRT